MTLPLSPARLALGDQQIKITEHAARVEAARVTCTEFAERIAAETAALQVAEAALTTAHGFEAAAVLQPGHDAVPEDFAVDIAKAQADVDRHRRIVEALERAHAEAMKPLRDLELSAGILNSATENLIAAVITEVGADALASLAVASENRAKAEAKVRTLIAYVVGRRWLPLAERLNSQLKAPPAAGWTIQEYPDWPGFAAALATDPHATLQVPA